MERVGFLERLANTFRGEPRAAVTLELEPEARAMKSRRDAYKMSEVTRLTSEWTATLLHPDDEIRWSNRRMRARARELERNDPYARQFLNLLGVNAVGARGPKLQAQVRNNNGELNKPFNDKIEDAWAEFCESPMVDGRLTLPSYARLAMKTVARDGENFTRLYPGFEGNRFRFGLQAIDADQVDEMLNRRREDGKNEIRMGVEVNGWSAPIAYHIYREPERFFGSSSGRAEPDRVPASEVIHLYDSFRVNQTRGISWFHPIAVALKMLGGYTEAELVAARTAAAKMGWFQKKADAGSGAEINADPETNSIVMEANPGSIEFAPDGWEFTSWDPQHPSGAFAAFVKAKLREVATGLGVSYNALANDLEGVNYSSIRSGLLIERDLWRAIQEWWIAAFMRRIYREWLNASLLSGALVLDSRDARRFYAAKFSPRGWAWVDPLKDTQAGLLAIQSGLASRQMLLAEQGLDFEEVLDDLAEENEMAAAFGLDISGPKTAPVDDPNADDTADDTTTTKSVEVVEANRLLALNGGQRNGSS